MQHPEAVQTQEPQRRRLRFYLRLGAFVFAAGLSGAILWFVLHAEEIILSRLPREIQVNGISVSFLGRSFILNGVRISGQSGTPCEGRLLLEIAELKGQFLIRERRLTALSVDGADLMTHGWQKACFSPATQTRIFSLADIAVPAGLEVDFSKVKLPLPYLGEAVLSGSVKLREPAAGILHAAAPRLVIAGVRIQGEARQLELDFHHTNGSWQVATGDFSATIKLKHLEKISRLSSKRLSVVGGNADIRLTANARRGLWKVFTHIELSKLRLRGEPFYSMPLGLVQLTPENVWPMVEDAPGFFTFSFETEAKQGELVKKFTADLRHSLTTKVKSNLKKKIPVLPF